MITEEQRKIGLEIREIIVRKMGDCDLSKVNDEEIHKILIKAGRQDLVKLVPAPYDILVELAVDEEFSKELKEVENLLKET